mmetsp:Transcript_3759/g.5757  ORF Transcript_3759/g.5757 Transcript_3759/m.5757 type:complete len:115 (-) Transcript_3759:172-516(-)
MVATRSSSKKGPKDLVKPNVEKKENDETSAQPSTEEEENTSTIEQKLREKKPLPSVRFLLEHGDPNSPPPSFQDTMQLFLGLLVAFVLSLVAWHFLFLKGSGPGQAKNWGKDEM